MTKIIIGSPIKQKSKILNEFLISLDELNLEGLEVSYYFIDDNTEDKSSELLNNFKKAHKNVILEHSSKLINSNESYVCNEIEHRWKKNLINRVILFKNAIIDYAKENNYDYLFFIDSDIVLHRQTIKHLIDRNVDIVSNVFWTQWVQNDRVEPQVWLQDVNNFYLTDWDKNYTKHQIEQMCLDFINQMKIPGIYKVGGLGACTLMNKKAINSGVNFSVIDNVSFWGEDRHFCIRARVLGLNLYVDTVYPAYHIYREELLAGVKKFKKNGFDFEAIVTKNPKHKSIMRKIKNKLNMFLTKFKLSEIEKSMRKMRQIYFNKKRKVSDKNKLVLSMLVKNEDEKYLEETLTTAIKYVDEVIIIDDACTENAVEICNKILHKIPHKIIINEKGGMDNEAQLRKKQWEETVKSNPDWILFLDADEVFEEKMEDQIKYLILNNDVDTYCFRSYDMWNKDEYRDDNLWNTHTRYTPFLIRYHNNYKYRFANAKYNGERVPSNALNLNLCNSEIKLKHYGWMDPNDRKKQYNCYMKSDPDGKLDDVNKYKSILDKKPNLVRFEEKNEN